MKLEAGKRYITRDGRVTTAIGYSPYDDTMFGWLPHKRDKDCEYTCMWLVNGGNCTVENSGNKGDESLNEHDLVEEYMELFDDIDITEDNSKETDVVNNPKHYTQGKIEVIDFIEDQKLGFAEANVVKYVVRHKHKNGLEDLKKAEWYIQRLITNYDKDNSSKD